MRTFFTLVAIIFISSFTANAQEILNSDFEDWFNQQYFEDPDEFISTNVMTFFVGGEPNVTKTTDAVAGSYALQLETVETDEGPVAGAVFIGEPGDGGFAGGIPYAERPDSMNFFAKFDVAPMDTAYVAVLFKKFGAPIGICFAQLTGTQDTYLEYSLPVIWLVPIISPDTMATGIISSSLFSMPTIGSTITVDSITLPGASIPYPNNSFEYWTEFASEEAEYWTSSNIFTMPASDVSVTKTSDSYVGDFAIRIENMVTMWEDTMGFITNGTIGDDGPTGGMPVEDVPDILSGYYKYEPVGQDSALAGMFLTYYNEELGVTEILDSAYMTLPAASDYTYFEIPCEYYSLPEPDTVNIAFASGNLDGEFVGLGSVLHVDALDITFKPHIVAVGENEKKIENVYPNPAHEKVFFEMAELMHQQVFVTVYNSTGQAVVNQEFGSNASLSLDVDHLPTGVYMYHIKVGQKYYQGKFIVE